MKRFLGIKTFLPWLLGLVALAVVLRPESLSAPSAEFALAGSDWLHKSQIILVGSWSASTPIMLAIASWFGGLGTVLRVALMVLTLALSLLSIARTNKLIFGVKASNLGLIFFALALCLPSTWSGIDKSLVSTVLICFSYIGYLSWKASSPTDWLFGKVSKNYRWMILSALSVAGLIFANPLLTLLVMPIVLDLVRSHNKNWQDGLRWGAMLAVPSFVLFWVWFSILSPRKLLHDGLLTSPLFERQLSLHASLPNSQIAIIATFIIIFLGACSLLISLNAKMARKNLLAWLMAFAVSATIIIVGKGSLTTYLLPFLAMAAMVSGNYQPKRYLAFELTALSLLVCVVFGSLEARSQRRLDNGRVQLVANFIQQRNAMLNPGVFYYGKGAGFYEQTGFDNSTRFYDASVFVQDERTSLNLEEQLRGDLEQYQPGFAVIALGDHNSAVMSARMQQYFDKHYEKAEQVDGFTILRRK